MPRSARSLVCLSQTRSQPWPLCLAAALLFLFLAPAGPLATADDPRATSAGDVADLGAIQRAFERVVEKVAPSVVGIRAQRRHLAVIREATPGAEADLFEQRVVVNGSGTIVSQSGLILTNEHVVQSATNIDVMFHDGQKLPATVLAADPRSDLAILQVDRDHLPTATFCDWQQVARGQWTIALGNPFGLGRDGKLSVSIGVVANLGRQLPGLGEVDDRFYSNMIQTTAAINPGNSGGPLFNIRGELIGIVTAMHTRAPADEGVGFAIPITPAKRRVIDDLCQGRPVRYGYLGLTVRVPHEEELKSDSAGDNRGVVVERLEPNGPAHQAGIQIGDLILRYDHQLVRGPSQLAELVGHTSIGTQVDLDLLRDGRVLTVTAIVGLRDVSRVSWMRGGAVLWRGMRLADLTEDARRLMRLDIGVRGVVVIDVVAGGPADQAGIEIGQVINAVDGDSIQDTSDFLLRVRTAKGALAVSIPGHGTRIIFAKTSRILPGRWN